MTDDEERNLQRLADLEEGLYRKRLISYGGLLKEIHKELNLDDAENRFIDDLQDTYEKILSLRFGSRSESGLNRSMFVMFTEFEIVGDVDEPYVDGYQDQIIYSILDSEWRKKK